MKTAPLEPAADARTYSFEVDPRKLADATGARRQKGSSKGQAEPPRPARTGERSKDQVMTW